MKKLLSILLVLALMLCLSAAALASGEPSGASGEASSDELYPKFDEYKAYLLETLLLDPFWQGQEDLLRADLDAAQTPDAECIQNFTGSAAVDQAPPGVVFPLTYDAWYAENGGAQSVEDAFIEYIHNWLLDELNINANMTIEQVEDEFMPLVKAWNFTDFPAEMIYSGMLEQGVPMTFEEFKAQYKPAGETMSVEDAFIEYLHEWLIAEDEINDNMDENIRENEFMPLIRAWNFTDFPAEMLWSGMLEQGVPMTFDEFKAQYVPAAAPAAGGDTSFEAFVEYLHQWLIAEDEINDNMDESIRENEFMPLIRAGNFTDFPAEMLWSGMLEQGVPMTYDEFVAAGGVY